MSTAVLFARSDSCYFDLAAPVYDETRDARTYEGPFPVVAHPPCRGWGRLSHLAKPQAHELELAVFAVHCVRSFGGVLEHPFGSKLWAHCGLPKPGHGVDAFGGFSLLVCQGWFGHEAVKPTILYIVGRDPFVPELDVSRRPGGSVDRLTRSQREATPRPFAKWLLAIAQGCYVEEVAA